MADAHSAVADDGIVAIEMMTMMATTTRTMMTTTMTMKMRVIVHWLIPIWLRSRYYYENWLLQSQKLSQLEIVVIKSFEPVDCRRLLMNVTLMEAVVVAGRECMDRHDWEDMSVDCDEWHFWHLIHEVVAGVDTKKLWKMKEND